MDQKYIDYLVRTSNNLKILAEDIQKIIASKEKEEKEPPSLKSIQQRTVLRDNVEELKDAQENPELTFVKDQIEKIFSS